MEVSLSGPPCRADAAWDTVVETGVMLRLAGAPPVRVRLAEDADGEIVPAGTMLGPAGLRHAFEDASLRWVRGSSLSFVRRIDGPLLREVRYEARLKHLGDGAGVRPEVTLGVDSRIKGFGGALQLYTRGVRAGWTREFNAIEGPGRAVKKKTRRPLDVTTQAALSRWTDHGARPALRARVEQWLREAPARQLHGVRPRLLAAGWDDEDEQLDVVIDDLVEACAAGVVELYWVVHCPRCRADVLRVDGLNGLPEQARCGACGVVHAVDLARTVEVVLAAPAWLRSAEPTCPAVAAGLPEVAAAVLLQAGGSDTLELALDPGSYRIVAGAGAERLDGTLEVSKGGASTASWAPGEATVRLGTRATLTLDNPRRRRHFVRIVDDARPLPRLSAIRMLTRPRFQARLGGHAPAPGVILEIGDATLLLVDLADTAAYFEAHGDRAGVRHLRRRLDAAAARVESRGGVRIKTLGDGILAMFPDPVRAAMAACDLLTGPEAGHAGEPALRLGMARGPLLTQHTDVAGLDCFGGTVAAASLAVYLAPPMCLQLSGGLCEDADVKGVLASYRFGLEALDTGRSLARHQAGGR